MIFTAIRHTRKVEEWQYVDIAPSNNLPAKAWCNANYAVNRYYYWYGINRYWFDDPKIATEFALRFA
jgi:hypothetical protein